jgi:hypothetical protein
MNVAAMSLRTGHRAVKEESEDATKLDLSRVAGISPR